MTRRPGVASEDAADETYPFLCADLSRLRAPKQPMNVFELSGFPRWETVASRVLAFFLDPHERHRMGTAGVDALLELLDGTKPLATTTTGSRRLAAGEAVGSAEWLAKTEVGTDDRKRIDILLTNDELDIAILIENKLDAAVYNPLASYVRQMTRRYSTVLSVLLAPSRRAMPLDQEWVSASVTYDEFFDRLKVKLATGELAADARSVDILDQFIENTSEKEQRLGTSAEAEVLEDFWRATVGQDKQLGAFFKALARVNEILKRRAEHLAPMIQSELDARALFGASWLAVGNERAWGRSDSRVAIVYVAFELVSGNCIELMLGQHPDTDWSGFAVKAYPNRSRPDDLYHDFNHVPLAVDWRATDAEIVSAFLTYVEDLELRHPRSAD